MTASARRWAVEWRSTQSASGSWASRVVRNCTASPSESGRRRSRVAPFTRASTACSASFGPIARAASRPVAPSASSSSAESGRMTFIAQVRIDRPRGYFRGMRTGTWAAVAVAPLFLLVLLLARPTIDGAWENHPAHFWLVLGAALVATALGFSVTTAARRRRDARLFLISLAFIASAAFLGLHALATPGVLLGPNAGFELATPFGLLLAAMFAAAAALELRSDQAERILRWAPALLVALGAIAAAWAALSLAELPPLDDPLADERLDGWQLLLAALGVA